MRNAPLATTYGSDEPMNDCQPDAAVQDASQTLGSCSVSIGCDATLLSKGSLDLAPPRVVALDHVAVVASHDAHQFGQARGGRGVQPLSERVRLGNEIGDQIRERRGMSSSRQGSMRDGDSSGMTCRFRGPILPIL